MAKQQDGVAVVFGEDDEIRVSPLTLCKNCEYGNPVVHGDVYCGLITHRFMGADFFCFAGKRKKEAT